MAQLFRHGDLKLYLLKLLDEEPRHGYQIILQLENRFLGMYSPSPGTVYPRLQALEEEGLIEVVDESEGRKVYRLTERGRSELRERAEELRELGDRVARSARDLAREIRDEVRASVRDLRRDVRDAARDARRQERRVARGIRIEIGEELRGALRSLRSDLEVFMTDVMAAAKRHGLGEDRLRDLRDVLNDTRVRVIEVIETPDRPEATSGGTDLDAGGAGGQDQHDV
jgi:DNA-binding PadR family transcriptional regulator